MHARRFESWGSAMPSRACLRTLNRGCPMVSHRDRSSGSTQGGRACRAGADRNVMQLGSKAVGGSDRLREGRARHWQRDCARRARGASGASRRSRSRRREDRDRGCCALPSVATRRLTTRWLAGGRRALGVSQGRRAQRQGRRRDQFCKRAS